jgi:hypothetical protein
MGVGRGVRNGEGKTMRRSWLAAAVAVPGFLIGSAAPAGAEGAEIIRREAPCSVAFDNAERALDPECDVINIHHPDGGYTLVLHGQVQDGDMEAFVASGVRRYSAEWPAGECFAAYLFVVDEGHTPVWSDSVRHFTPDGQMTETCHYQNPFVGSWQNNDDADGSHQRVQISASGHMTYRDDAATLCGGEAFKWSGAGEFVDGAFEVEGDSYCRVDSGWQESPLGMLSSGFDEVDGLLYLWIDGSCWYRSGTDPAQCAAP